MKILDLKDLKKYKNNSVVTIGFFDGIHKAHQVLLNNLVTKAKENNYESVVITFSDEVLSLFKMSNNIMTLDDKLGILRQLGVDNVVVLSPLDNFMGMSAKEFKEVYLDSLNTKIVVCGSDFSFAKNKEGNIEYLKNNSNYEILEIEDIFDENSNKISSTYIRNLLKEGKVDLANKYLYSNFSTNSLVISGKEIGRTIGFKTANLLINNQLKLLKHGVYFGKVFFDNMEYKAMINVGYNPTVNDEESLKVEVHIANFNKEIYDDTIKVVFVKFHREEKKFASLNELQTQLQLDLIKLEN